MYKTWLQATLFFSVYEMGVHNNNNCFLIRCFFCLVMKLCPTLCDPMNHSTPGLPVHHHSWSLLKLMSFESVMPSNHLILGHPLLLLPSIFPYIRVFSNESALHQVAKILEFQLQHQSCQWTPRTDFLYDGLVGSPCSPKDSQESSPTPQFKSINSSVLSFLFSPTLTSIHDHWNKPQPWLNRPSLAK